MIGFDVGEYLLGGLVHKVEDGLIEYVNIIEGLNVILILAVPLLYSKFTIIVFSNSIKM